MVATFQLLLVDVIEFASEQREERIVLLTLRLKGAENSLPNPQIADAPAANLCEVLAFKIRPYTRYSKC
jgi:hypothetical protein